MMMLLLLLLLLMMKIIVDDDAAADNDVVVDDDDDDDSKTTRSMFKKCGTNFNFPDVFRISCFFVYIYIYTDMMFLSSCAHPIKKHTEMFHPPIRDPESNLDNPNS